MRFKLMAASLAIGSVAFAAEPIAVFSAQKDDILLSRVFESEGCCFGVGEVDVQGKSKLAEEMARKKAELAAQSDLLANQVLKGVKWPETWSQQEITEARAFAKSHVNYSSNATVRELQTLYLSAKDGRCISVVGAPVSGVDIVHTMDFSEIKKAMSDYESEQRRIAAATNAPLFSVNVSSSSNAKRNQIVSPKHFTPIDLGGGKKILMNNADKDDLLF